MVEDDGPLGLVGLTVPLVGAVQATGDPFEPYRLADPAGEAVSPVTVFLADLQACGRAAATQRSYSMALLRWFRFLWAVEVRWDQATRVEARDFVRWVQVAGRPARRHWRGDGAAGVRPGVAVPNRVTGKSPPGPQFAAATVAHGETVARSFYDFHLQAGTGPLVNPFPLARAGRAHAHHNPMDRFDGQRAGLFRPRVAQRIPRQIPDGKFDELFAALCSHRDRALLAFWISTGARASELLGVLASGIDPGQQLITVIRKGSRAIQQLPASPDAFVWLRLYQQQVHGLVPARPCRSGVVDVAAAVPGIVLSGGQGDVRAGQSCSGSQLDASRPAALGVLPAGQGSAGSAHRCPVDPGPCAFVHDETVPRIRRRRTPSATCWPTTIAAPRRRTRCRSRPRPGDPG